MNIVPGPLSKHLPVIILSLCRSQDLSSFRLQFFLTNELFLTYVSKVFKIYWTGRILIFYKYALKKWIALKARSDWLLNSELILRYS